MLDISVSVFWPFEILPLRILCLVLYPIFNWVILILVSNFLTSLHILQISPFSDEGLVKIFSHSVSCLIVLWTVSFVLQKLLSFRRSHLFIFALSVCATVVIFRKCLCAHAPKATFYFPSVIGCL